MLMMWTQSCHTFFKKVNLCLILGFEGMGGNKKRKTIKHSVSILHYTYTHSPKPKIGLLSIKNPYLQLVNFFLCWF
jgi:hypothetical protein